MPKLHTHVSSTRIGTLHVEANQSLLSSAGSTLAPRHGAESRAIDLHGALAPDGNRLLELCLRRFRQLAGLAGKIGLFRIGLGTDRDVFSCRHGHRTGHEASQPRDQDLRLSRSCRGDADNEARSRHQSVVGTEHGRAEHPRQATSSARRVYSPNPPSIHAVGSSPAAARSHVTLHSVRMKASFLSHSPAAAQAAQLACSPSAAEASAASSPHSSVGTSHCDLPAQW